MLNSPMVLRFPLPFPSAPMPLLSVLAFGNGLTGLHGPLPALPKSKGYLLYFYIYIVHSRILKTK